MLIIDDDERFAVMLGRALSAHVEVLVVIRAADALARLRAGERFDVVLCDLMMPTMDGVEFHRMLAAQLPEEADRIVFMSGGAFTVRIETFIARAPNRFVEKPIDVDGLVALVERRVGGFPTLRPRAVSETR